MKSADESSFVTILLGLCDGDGSTCCNNYLEVDNNLWNFVLLPVAISDMIERLEKSRAVVEWIRYRTLRT